MIRHLPLPAAHAQLQPALGKFICLFYTVVTPALNPLLTTLRNKEVKGGTEELPGGWVWGEGKMHSESVGEGRRGVLPQGPRMGMPTGKSVSLAFRLLTSL